MKANRHPPVSRSSAINWMIFLAGLLMASSALAQTAGTVTHLSGILVDVKADGTSKLLSVGSIVDEGDTIETRKDTYTRIKFNDGGELVLRPDSQLTINSYHFKPDEPAKDNMLLSLIKGGLRSVTGLLGKRNPKKEKVDTVTATVGIRGTHFGLLMCQNDCGDIPTVSGRVPANGLHLDVAAGAILVSNRAGQQIFTAGQFGFVANAATLPIIVPPSQGIQVTMPPSISQNNAGGRSLGKGKDNSNCVVQ